MLVCTSEVKILGSFVVLCRLGYWPLKESHKMLNILQLKPKKKRKSQKIVLPF